MRGNAPLSLLMGLGSGVGAVTGGGVGPTEIGRVISVNMLLTTQRSSKLCAVIFDTHCSVNGSGIMCNIGARKRP